MDIFVLRYTKADLAVVPETERSLLLRLGSFHNDIQILNKQMVMAMQVDQEATNDIIRQGAHAVAMLNLRMLAGRLYEGWLTLRDNYPSVAGNLAPTLSADAGDHHAVLSAYFVRVGGGQASLLERVRHTIGFHAGDRITVQAFGELPEEMDMSECICPALGNTLFFSAEMTLVYVVNRLCGSPEGGFPAAMAILQRDASRVASAFGGFVAGYASAIMQRYFPERLVNLRRSAVDIGEPPFLSVLRNPYFVDTGGHHDRH